MSERGLYQRPSGIWWVRTTHGGQELRCSTRTKDLETARKFRDAVLLRFTGRATDLDWQKRVDVWARDSNSWLCQAHCNMRQASKRRGWDQPITFAEFVQLAKLSNGRCAVTGLALDTRRGEQKRHRPFGVSVDREDSGRGYIAGNVRLVCLAVNIAMRNWGETALVVIAKALAARELFKETTNLGSLVFDTVVGADASH